MRVVCYLTLSLLFVGIPVRAVEDDIDVPEAVIDLILKKGRERRGHEEEKRYVIFHLRSEIEMGRFTYLLNLAAEKPIVIPLLKRLASEYVSKNAAVKLFDGPQTATRNFFDIKTMATRYATELTLDGFPSPKDEVAGYAGPFDQFVFELEVAVQHPLPPLLPHAKPPRQGVEAALRERMAAIVPFLDREHNSSDSWDRALYALAWTPHPQAEILFNNVKAGLKHKLEFAGDESEVDKSKDALKILADAMRMNEALRKSDPVKILTDYEFANDYLHRGMCAHLFFAEFREQEDEARKVVIAALRELYARHKRNPDHKTDNELEDRAEMLYFAFQETLGRKRGPDGEFLHNLSKEAFGVDWDEHAGEADLLIPYFSVLDDHERDQKKQEAGRRK